MYTIDAVYRYNSQMFFYVLVVYVVCTYPSVVLYGLYSRRISGEP